MIPYLITGPAQIGISGGRTSGHMVYKILEAHGGTLPPDVHLFFQNTGKEREETLVFIDQIAKRWNVNIVWMEWCRVYGQPDDAPWYKLVDFETASRNGELLKDELRDGVERMQNYGFTSHPTGGDVAFAAIGGNREQGIVLVVDDRRYRIPLEAGEVAMYDDLGNKIELLRDMIKVTAVQRVEVEAPTIKIIGNLEVVGNITTTGTITNNGKHVDSTHQHSGVTAGSGSTGAPI